jgi:hypothetical protein
LTFTIRCRVGDTPLRAGHAQHDPDPKRRPQRHRFYLGSLAGSQARSRLARTESPERLPNVPRRSSVEPAR